MGNEAPKPHTIDELAKAVGDYGHAHGEWSQAARMVETKRKEMESFIIEEARTRAKVEYFSAIVKKIAKDLEK
jgi:hypothetical protein